MTGGLGDVLACCGAVAIAIVGWFLRKEANRIDTIEWKLRDIEVDLVKNSEQNRQLFHQVSQMRDDLKSIADKLDRLIESR